MTPICVLNQRGTRFLDTKYPPNRPKSEISHQKMGIYRYDIPDCELKLHKTPDLKEVKHLSAKDTFR